MPAPPPAEKEKKKVVIDRFGGWERRVDPKTQKVSWWCCDRELNDEEKEVAKQQEWEWRKVPVRDESTGEILMSWRQLVIGAPDPREPLPQGKVAIFRYSKAGPSKREQLAEAHAQRIHDGKLEHGASQYSQALDLRKMFGGDGITCP